MGIMARTTKKEEPEPEVEEDSFIKLVQSEIEALLRMPLEPKEKNAIIMNAIRFLGVRNKVSGGDDDGFWGN
jgi:hypothetical protein